MSDINLNKDAFIFMKVGAHAGENFDSILKRKMEEVKKVGFSFWGYGGKACHPLNQVQPFAKKTIQRKGSIYLFMEHINSNADPDIVPATEFSEDGIHWKPIPDGILVTGSRYALVLDEIKPGELEIPISAYEVGIGRSMGKSADNYLKGRIDKACLEFNPERLVGAEVKSKKISYTSKLLDPYAVFVR